MELSFCWLACSQSGMSALLTTLHGHYLFLTTVGWTENNKSANRSHPPPGLTWGQRLVQSVGWEPTLGSFRPPPPLSHLQRQDRQLLGNHSSGPFSVCPSGQLLTLWLSTGYGTYYSTSLPSVSVPVTGFLSWPPATGLELKIVPLTQTLSTWLHHAMIQHSLGWLPTTLPQAASWFTFGLVPTGNLGFPVNWPEMQWQTLRWP